MKLADAIAEVKEKERKRKKAIILYPLILNWRKNNPGKIKEYSHRYYLKRKEKASTDKPSQI